MRKDDRRIAVLRDLTHRPFDLVEQELHVLVADKGGELPAKIGFGAPQVADVGQSGVEHVALAQQTRRVAQERPLLFAREMRHLLGP